MPPESLGVIKTFSNMSVPMFINSHRIEYAIKLINDGYLQNYSIEALAEKSGFNSQENFNKIFKLLKTVRKVYCNLTSMELNFYNHILDHLKPQCLISGKN